MNQNVYLQKNQSLNRLNKFIPKAKEKPFEFCSEKRARIAQDIKDRFKFSHGGTGKRKK